MLSIFQKKLAIVISLEILSFIVLFWSFKMHLNLFNRTLSGIVQYAKNPYKSNINHKNMI